MTDQTARPARDDALPDDPPLDAAQLKLQSRFRLLLSIGYGTLAIGLFAVVAAILYRTDAPAVEPGRAAIAGRLAAEVALPAGGRVVGASLEGGHLLVTIETPSGAVLVVYGLADLAEIRRLALARP